MSESAHSLEAGGSFPVFKKARQARIEHRGHVSESAHSLEAGSSFPVYKKQHGGKDSRHAVFFVIIRCRVVLQEPSPVFHFTFAASSARFCTASISVSDIPLFNFWLEIFK
ncbi:MAG: hypothetical protein FWF77_08220 [Defluviitaleaceae bacterium]|nr:hypothetical protein [Defluviitaleaceae bacterium]